MLVCGVSADNAGRIPTNTLYAVDAHSCDTVTAGLHALYAPCGPKNSLGRATAIEAEWYDTNHGI